MSTRRRASTRSASAQPDPSPSPPPPSAASSRRAAGHKRARAASAQRSPAAAKGQQQGEEEEEEEQQEEGTQDMEEDAEGEEEGEKEDSEEEEEAADTRPSQQQQQQQQQPRTPAAHHRIPSSEQGSPAFVSVHATSPLLRQSRLAERAELGALNKRLELYILRQRERDAAATGLDRELAMLRSKFAAATTSEAQRHEARYDELRRQKLDLSAQLQVLRDEADKQAHTLKDAQAHVSLYKARCAEMEKRIRALEAELTTVGNARIALDGQVKHLTTNLAEETEARKNLAHQVAEQQDAITVAHKQLNVVQSKADRTLQEFEMLQATSGEEISTLTRLNKSLTRENQSIEEKLRKEFGAQLKALLAERQEQYEEEQEEALGQLKAFYEQSLRGKDEMIHSMQERIDQTMAESTQLTRELAESKKNSVLVATLRAEYEAQISALHSQAEQSRRKFEAQLNEQHLALRTAQQTIAAKDREFATLMDVKIRLDREIKQYDALLDNEEERLGFSGGTPGRRGSRTGAGAAAAGGLDFGSTGTTTTSTSSSSFSSSSSSSHTGRRATLHVPALTDASGSNVGLSLSASAAQKRFTLTNSNRIDESSPDAGTISLTNLSLVATQSKARFRVSEHAPKVEPLRPGESMVVYTNAANAARAPRRLGQQVVVWEGVDEEALWNEGETVQVKEGQKVTHAVNIRV